MEWSKSDLITVISKKHLDLKEELESLRNEILELKSIIRELKTIIILEKD
jgi:hypothetical protein